MNASVCKQLSHSYVSYIYDTVALCEELKEKLIPKITKSISKELMESWRLHALLGNHFLPFSFSNPSLKKSPDDKVTGCPRKV